MQDEGELSELRAAIEASRDVRGRARVASALKARIVAYTKRRGATGASFHDVSRELGLARSSVLRWFRDGGRSRGVVPVRVKPVSSASLTLRAAHGVVVEGLSVEQLVDVLRRLS